LIPFKSPDLLRALYPSLTWERKTDEKVVYLTFDDGPTVEVTDWVLDNLKDFNQKATFFCIGNNVELQPEIYQRVLAAGHEVGNHTQNHKNGWKSSTKRYKQEVEQCAEFVQSKLFRPPYGRIKRSQIQALKDQYEIVEWSVISKDYFPKLNIDRALKALKSNTYPGSIIVFHDSVKAFKNLEQILPAYLEYLRDQGYQSKTL